LDLEQLIFKTPSKSLQGVEGISLLLRKLNTTHSINSNEATTVDSTLNQEEVLIREKTRNIMQAMRQANIAHTSSKKLQYNISRCNSQAHCLTRITKDILRAAQIPWKATTKGSIKTSVSPTTRNYQDGFLSILKKNESRKQAKRIALKFTQNTPYPITSGLMSTLPNEKKVATGVKNKVGSLLWNSIDTESIKRTIPCDKSPRLRDRYNKERVLGISVKGVDLYANDTPNSSFKTKQFTAISLFKGRTRKSINLGINFNEVTQKYNEAFIRHMKQELYLQANESMVLLPTLKIRDELQSIKVATYSPMWIDPIIIFN